MSEQDLETHEEVKSPGALLADDFYSNPEEKAPEVPEVEDVVVEVEEPVEPSDEETFEPTSVEQLAEHLETDPEWMQGLTITQKVNGKEVEVKLADALATHRKVTAGDDYLADAKVKAKAQIEEAGTQRAELATAATVLGELLREAEKTLDQDSTDLEKLRKEDPAEYAARKADNDDRKTKIEQMKLRAAQAYQNTAQQISAQQKALRDHNLPKEQERLLERVPEWNDTEVAKKEQTDVVNYLSGDGYSQEDIQIAAYNGKLLALAVKAMRYDQSKSKVDVAKKKVVKIPKVLKSGASVDEAKPKADPNDRVSILYGPAS